MPGSCKCQSFSYLSGRPLFHSLGSAAELRKVLNLLSTLGVGEI